ncbi:hypothetical protein F511_05957 [Dorcoceras hygrometricum]|uniref:MAT1 centre domain-containing protein n=1 Tax=Dorcoceras hygrometricum TaxID=472368 RepID=A0A2Z7DHE3_9LAMI|nr:hypothetical protein F511_05957 [Dorcoceras hygrometricum]
MVVASGTNAFSKEMAIRKRIASIYNKRVEDFTALREYNDYLEEVEDMSKYTCVLWDALCRYSVENLLAVVNLTEGIDVPAIEMRIAQYQRENAEQIMNAQARKAEEYAAALAASRGQLVHTGVDALSSSQAGSSTGTQGHYAPVTGVGISQPRPTGMAPQPLPLGSSHEMLGLEYEDEEMMKLRAEKAARAGGWSIEMTRTRALEDAFSSIFV